MNGIDLTLVSPAGTPARLVRFITAHDLVCTPAITSFDLTFSDASSSAP